MDQSCNDLKFRMNSFNSYVDYRPKNRFDCLYEQNDICYEYLINFYEVFDNLPFNCIIDKVELDKFDRNVKIENDYLYAAFNIKEGYNTYNENLIFNIKNKESTEITQHYLELERSQSSKRSDSDSDYLKWYIIGGAIGLILLLSIIILFIKKKCKKSSTQGSNLDKKLLVSKNCEVCLSVGTVPFENKIPCNFCLGKGKRSDKGNEIKCSPCSGIGFYSAVEHTNCVDCNGEGVVNVYV